MEQHIAVVTGAASGIGRAIARRLAASGAAAVVADLDAEGGQETVALISEEGGRAFSHVTDVADPSSVADLRDAVRERLGTASIIVNNAGWDQGMPFLDTSVEFWHKVVGINYLGTVAMCHTFLPDMIQAGVHGHVINIASDAGRVGSMGETVYAGAKGGVIAFTKSLAREMARNNINVNCVSPGPTDTKLFFEQPEKVRNAIVRAIPFRKLAQPEDLANAVAFFASDATSYVTGQVLSVSGGLTMSD